MNKTKTSQSKKSKLPAKGPSMRWVILAIIVFVLAAGLIPIDSRVVEGCPGSNIGSTRRLHLILGDTIDEAIEERPVYSSPDVGCPAGVEYKLYLL